MINLKQILSHLPNDKITELEAITEKIIATKKTEMIILFGSYARGDYNESQGETRGRKSDYDILIICKTIGAANKLKYLLREITFDTDVVIQLEVTYLDYVNKDLEKGHYFLSDVIKEGKVMFDRGRFELATYKTQNPEERLTTMKADFKLWFEREAVSMYKHFKMDRDDKRYGLGGFHLQQCVESCYTCIEMVFKRYRAHEHRLEILRERVIKFDKRVNEAFPLDTEENIELFKHLDFAYIGGRYKSDEEFPVTRDQLNYWAKETRKLINRTEKICKEHIENFNPKSHD